MVAPTLDGTATGIATAASTVAATLTTTHTNDIICALVYIEKSAVNLWITGISGGGLTWQKRTQAANGVNSLTTTWIPQSLELWWAVAPSTLSSTTITATSNVAFDDAAILVFGVNGCNTTAPWEPNPSIPTRVFNTATPSFSGISTTNANDFLIFGCGSAGGWTSIGTVPTGFTAIGFADETSGAHFASVGAAYQAVTSTQSGLSPAWGSTIAINNNAAIFEALTADSGGLATPRYPAVEIATLAIASTTNTITIGTGGPSSNDVIVVAAYCEQTGGGPAITSVTGTSLTFTQRKRSNGSVRGSLELWYAQASGSLASDTITITYAANFDDCAVVVYSVAGCSTAIFDSNASVPAVLSNTAGSTWTPSISSISTTQAHNMMLAMTGVDEAGTGVATPPSGFQLMLAAENGGGGLWAYFGLGYQNRITTDSSATITWGASVLDGTGGEYLVDALTADSAATNVSITGVSSTTAAGTLTPQGSVFWNLGDSLNTTVSNGGLTATQATGDAAIRANQYVTSGKFYWEYTVTSQTSSDTGSGVATMTALLNQFGTTVDGAAMLFGSTTGIWVNGSSTGVTVGTVTTGSLIGVAVDFGAQLIWFRLNGGNWNGNATYNPATGTGGVTIASISGQPLLPSASMWASGDSITANFGLTAFSGTVPSGFTSGFAGAPNPLDGEGSVFNKTNTNSATVTLTTSQSNDIITLVSYAENVTAPTITSISGGSLTFTQRTRSHGSSRGSLEVWWALAASPLSAVTFTINYSANFDSQSAIMIGWAGMASTAWDSNVSVPALQSSNASSFTPSVSGISTSSAPGGVLLFSVGTSLDSTPNSPTGFAGFLANNPGSGATDWAYLKLMFQPITAAITSQSYATQTPVGNTSPGGIEVVFDALANISTATNVNVSITGVSSTSAVGTPTIGIGASVTLTGVATTSGIGAPTTSVSENPTITGVVASSAVGAPTISVGKSVAVTGVASASGIAAPTLTINTNPSITGVSSTSGIGTPTVSEVVDATITGVETDSAIGTPTLSISSSVSLTGVASTTGIGTPLASLDATIALTGIYATGVVAAVAVGISFSVALTGVVSTSSIGALVASGTLVGVVSTAAIGSPTLSISTNPSILVGVQSITALGIAQSAVEPLISGVASTSGIGTLTVSASLVNGVQSATGIGTLTVTHSLPVLVGQQIVCIPGFVQALSTGNQTNAAITGLQGTMSVGSLAVAKSIGITGVAVTGSVGVITTAITKAGMTVSDLNVQSISGQEPDLGLTVRWSDTEGQSWSDSVIRTIGEAGEYLTSIQVRRMGMSRRGRVYELSWSAPNATALTGVTILFEDSGT